MLPAFAQSDSSHAHSNSDSSSQVVFESPTLRVASPREGRCHSYHASVRTPALARQLIGREVRPPDHLSSSPRQIVAIFVTPEPLLRVLEAPRIHRRHLSSASRPRGHLPSRSSVLAVSSHLLGSACRPRGHLSSRSSALAVIICPRGQLEQVRLLTAPHSGHPFLDEGRACRVNKPSNGHAKLAAAGSSSAWPGSAIPSRLAPHLAGCPSQLPLRTGPAGPARVSSINHSPPLGTSLLLGRGTKVGPSFMNQVMNARRWQPLLLLVLSCL